MRLVLDLQAKQTDGSGYRGVGRYSEGLAFHLARQRGDDDMRICLSAAFPDSISTISVALQPALGRERISFCLDPSFAGPASFSADDVTRVSDALIRRHWMALYPDVLHVSHIFEYDIPTTVVPRVWPQVPGMVRSCTLYDLIPLRFPEHYFTGPGAKEWYLARLEFLRQCDHLLAISETSRLDAIELLGFPGDRITTIWGGVDEDRFRPRVLAEDEIRSFRTRHGLFGRFILHAGGDDYRKNVEGAITGFAEVPAAVRHGVQLAIVCRMSEDRRAALNRHAARCGLAARDVVMTGFVSDQDLPLFYNTCEAFVFPSIYEGLGLPVLEAMKSGAAVLGGRNSSIRELIGDDDAMFDASQPTSMAERIVCVLQDDGFRRRRRENGVARAKLFTWERTARLAWEGLRAARAAALPRAATALVQTLPKKRMALFTPMPPCRSNVADYNVALLPHLARHFKIDIFVDGDAAADRHEREHFTSFPHQEFERKAHEYDVIVYAMGNSEFHAFALPYLARYPGVVVLHDAHLGGVYRYLEFQRGERGRYSAEMLGAHGSRARRFLAPVQKHSDPIGGSVAELAATRSVIDQSIGVISHSPSGLKEVREAYPEGFAVSCRIIPREEEMPRPQGVADRSRAVAGNNGQTIAAEYAVAIDEMLQRQAAASLAGGIREIGVLVVAGNRSEAVVAGSARALQALQPAMLFRTQRLLIDVSYIAMTDHGTGIQRVVNSIVRQLYVSQRAGFCPLAVCLHEGRLIEATAWLERQGLLADGELLNPAPSAISIERGDCLLMLDSSWNRYGEFAGIFAAIRNANGLVYTAVYDLLPVRLPDSFLPDMVATFGRWLERAIAESDGLVCISRAVADDVCEFIASRPTARRRVTDVGYWHLGADLAQAPDVRLAPSPAMQAALDGRTLLMVGTVEPRKNHALALDAMERLWTRGVDVNLCIAGSEGWATETVKSRIKRHHERGDRLRWLVSPSDEDLQFAYRRCMGLLFLSSAEGFGLPLVEAARFGAPIACADIPVTHEVCGAHATYVPLDNADALADALEAWLVLLDAGDAPNSATMPMLTWEESAEALLGVVLDQRWYRSIRREATHG